MVGSISDPVWPDDKIATDLDSKSTTENRIATGIVSATGPSLKTFILQTPRLTCMFFHCIST